MEPREQGFTLLEQLLVVLLLAIAALIVMPAVGARDHHRAELAAREVAAAARFARSEALRSGQPHGLRLEPALRRVRVFRADTGTDPPTPVYDVRHPVSKRPYTVEPGGSPLLEGVELSDASAVWSGACADPGAVVIDVLGRPRCLDPWGVLLEEARIELTARDVTLEVVLAGETGRVTVE